MKAFAIYDDTVSACSDCHTEGGWFDFVRYPAPWIRCTACHGFGWRSAAADRYFARLALSA